MRYKITTLFDSPDMPIGTEIRAKEIYKSGKVAYLECYSDLRGYCWNAPVDKYDDPKWYKKELNEDWISDISCPKCGSTKGFLFSDSYYNSDLDDDSHGCNYSVGIECICGYKMIIYGTKCGNKYLRNKYGIDK